MNNITVIGCGRWGSFIAYYLDKIGKNVTLYGRSSSKDFINFKNTRTNGKVVLSDSLKLEDNLENALKNEVIVISINSQGLRDLMKEITNIGIKNNPNKAENINPNPIENNVLPKVSIVSLLSYILNFIIIKCFV